MFALALCVLAQGARVSVLGVPGGVGPEVHFGDSGAVLAAAAEKLQFGTSSGAVSVSPAGLATPLGMLAPTMAASAISAGSVAQWRLWDHESFDANDSNEWSLASRGVCGGNPDVFLGGPCALGAGETTRTYSAIPPHSRLRISARLHMFDNWQGESVFMKTDGQVCWTKAHTWCDRVFSFTCTKYGLDACGQETPDRLSVPVKVDMAHTAETLELTFGSTLASGSDACAASWGLDDIEIELI